MTEQTAVHVPTWTLGDRLRKAREFAGLEQGELADRIGISRGTVSNYELSRGQRPPKRLVLRAWAEITGVPLDWLAGDLLRPEVRVQAGGRDIAPGAGRDTHWCSDVSAELAAA